MSSTSNGERARDQQSATRRFRLALDHPISVLGFASLTVVPTLDAWAGVDKGFAMSAFHWFLLAQPFDLPERLLAADSDAFIDQALAKMAGGLDRLEPEVLDAYRRASGDPAVRRAICEDYRAAAEEDAEPDAADRAAGRKLACPVLVLWPEQGRPRPETPLDIWRGWAADVACVLIPVLVYIHARRCYDSPGAEAAIAADRGSVMDRNGKTSTPRRWTEA